MDFIDRSRIFKKKKEKISKKRKRYQEEEIEKYDNRKKEIEFEKSILLTILLEADLLSVMVNT